MMLKYFFIFLLIPGLVSSKDINLYVAANHVLEWSITTSRTYEDPFQEIDLHAIIKDANDKSFRLPAYWAGEDIWRFRFSSPIPGEYHFETICSDTVNTDLHGISGKITVTEYKGDHILYKHGPIRISQNQRLLEHEDGKPFFWLADSWWHGMTSRFQWPADFKILTQDREEKGFTVIQFAIGFPCDIHPFDPRGQNEAGDPWDPLMNSINPDYFDLADQRIFWLVKEGLIPNIVGSWGYYIKWLGVEKMKKHWDYLIARYGAFPVT